MQVGEGINGIIRDAFWFEGRLEWAQDTLDCFEGITQEQKNAILNGEGYLKPIEGGRMELVMQIDRDFKTKLRGHQLFIGEQIQRIMKEVKQDRAKIRQLENNLREFGDRFDKEQKKSINRLRGYVVEGMQKLESIKQIREWYVELNPTDTLPELRELEIEKTVNLAGYSVPEDLLDEYTNHVVKRLRGSMRMVAFGLPAIDDPLKVMELEQRRRELHGLILHSVGLKRKGEGYFKFDKALQKYLEEHGAGLECLPHGSENG